MRRIWIAGFAAVMVAIGAPNAALAQSRPPAVEDALKRGLAMAQRQQWPLAIRYFSQAQQAAPTDPVVLFNLALANDRAPGRNVIAAAWYRAYLAAAPGAQNAETVRTRVVDLEIEVEAQLLEMLDTAIVVSAQLDDAARTAAMARIAGAQAAGGDVLAAEATVASLGDRPQAGWARARIAAAHARKGNLAAGLQVANAIKHRRARSWAQAEIAVHQAMRNNLAAAAQTAAGMEPGPERDWAFSRIAVLQSWAGDVAGANASADRIGEKSDAFRLAANAAAASRMGRSDLPWQAEKARKFLDTALGEAQGIRDPVDRQVALLQVVRARAGMNDAAGARQAMLLMADARFRHLAQAAMAEATGDAASAGIHRFSAIATEAAAVPEMNDVAALLERAKAGDPAQAVRTIAAAAEQRARFLDALRAASD